MSDFGLIVMFMRPLPILRWLSLATAALVVLHVASFPLDGQLGLDRTRGFLRQFDLNGEGNLGAWFESFLLLCSALTVVLIALDARERNNPMATRWGVFAAGLLVMAVDETAQVHNTVSGGLRHGFGTSGLLYHAWVLPALVVVAVAFVYLLPLVREVPLEFQGRLFLAAGVYVGGAIGLEILGGPLRTLGKESLPYQMIMTLEEVCELAGLLLLMATLFRLAGHYGTRVTLGFGPHAFGVVSETAPDAVRVVD